MSFRFLSSDCQKSFLAELFTEVLELFPPPPAEPPPVALVLPEHVVKRDAPVRSHDLGSYDRDDKDKTDE